LRLGVEQVRTYRTARPVFSSEEYVAQCTRFYRLPARWGTDLGTSPLSELWRLGGVAAISVLPILGQYAGAKFAHDLAMPKEKLARLGGVDPASVMRAARALATLGLARCTLGRYHGMRLTKWLLLPEIGAPHRASPGIGASEQGDPFFYFSSALVYGGNWRQLTGSQRAVYLAAATRAHTYAEPPERIELVRWSVPSAVPRDDLTACYRFDLKRRWLRLAEVSYEELRQLTGLSLSSVKVAVKGLKHPSAWPAVHNDVQALQYAPLRVYPTSGGSLVYHFRDHVEHWPWKVLQPITAETTPMLAEEGGWTPYED
jgi:hypothetical protein